MIRLEGVGLRPAGPPPRTGRLDLLADVSLNIRSNEYMGVVGVNGAGKSLLLQILAGLRRPTTGKKIFDESIECSMGLVFQSPDDQIVGSTVERDLAFGLENRGVAPAEIRRRVNAALEWSGLAASGRRPPHLLSEGEKQRLALAAALVLEPAVLLLDEPGSRLDPEARGAFLARIHEVRERAGTTVVHVTHRGEELAGADRVVGLDGGRIVWEGAASALRDPGVAAPLGVLPPPPELPPAIPPSTVAPAPSRAGDPLVALAGVQWSPDPDVPGAREVLRGVDLELRPGDALGITGRSGAGKTTLATILAGLLAPTGGSVRPRPGREPRLPLGLVFQEPERGFFEETVLADVAFGALNRGLGEADARRVARDALRRVGLDPDAFGPRAPETLSGGEARRAGIAGVLAWAPAALVLDEPTTGLDADGVSRLRGVLGGLRSEGTAYALVSHERPLLDAECAEVRELEGGTLRPAPACALSPSEDAG